jgi:hypothetical protein
VAGVFGLATDVRGLRFRLSLLLSALILVIAAPLALSVPPVLADDPCPHEHAHQSSGHQHSAHQHSGSRSQHQPGPQQDHRTAVAVCCCIGIFAAIPDPAQSAVVTAPAAGSAVQYWDTNAHLSGHLVEPDPTPPRPIA